MELINPRSTYEVTYEEEGVPQEKLAVFVLRKLSADEVNKIDDEITISKGDDAFAYLGGTASRMKIQMALVDWKNITDDKGTASPCNNQTKGLIPSEIQRFLVKRIDEDNGLTKTQKRKTLEKN